MGIEICDLPIVNKLSVCKKGNKPDSDEKNPIEKVEKEIESLERVSNNRFVLRDVRISRRYSLAVAYQRLYGLTGDEKHLRSAEINLKAIVNGPNYSLTSRPIMCFESLLKLAEIHLVLDPQKSIEYSDRVMRESPVFTYGYRNEAKLLKGSALLRMGKSKEAAELFKEVKAWAENWENRFLNYRGSRDLLRRASEMLQKTGGESKR